MPGLGELSAHKTLWPQQHLLPVSQPDAISSLLVIEEQHNAQLFVQLWPADEPADTDMGTSRQVLAGSLLLLQVGDEGLDA